MARDREDRFIDPKIRAEVLERDQGVCRICGRWLDIPALHHIVFKSQGGLDLPSNLLSVGWLPGHDCHLTVAHGPEARMWRDIFQEVIETPGATALQVRRWRLNSR